MILKSHFQKLALTFFVIALFVSSTTALAFQSVKLASTLFETKKATNAPVTSQTVAPEKEPTPPVAEVTPAITNIPPTAKTKKAIQQAPPPTNPAPQAKTEKIIEKTESGNQVAIASEGGVTETDVATYNFLVNATTAISAPDQIPFRDETEKNANLETPLKDFFKNNLLWTKTEIKQMRQIIITDCADCQWNGNYTGSYSTSGNTITDAFGWITLNVHNYKDSKYLIDYMKIILTHEYGHHWSLYYKWTKLNLGVGTRFPDDYYSTRLLPKEKTASDYSLGWDHSDGEIVAEDYQYFYSGYSTHAMKDLFGLPPDAIKKWFTDLGNTISPINSTVPTNETKTDNPASATSHTAEPTETATSPSPTATPIETAPAPDTTKPIVAITKPTSPSYEWTSGDLAIEANATDNVKVVKMSVYINDALIGSVDTDGVVATWHYDRAKVGQYIFRITAEDSAGNVGEATITITKIAKANESAGNSAGASKQVEQTSDDRSQPTEQIKQTNNQNAPLPDNINDTKTE
ncbi:hypothetical protein COV39_02645 [Candidatus Berkelbacteria bacterium CG11_big_fil_rev_8_21_14_0_20_40_23]|uniref:HYR domain-containing protein n=1 Tax=Candidatus Berkelbacteria bacterium CG03_land_8_20_14_0_80_40_36 TaxID=1974509 RepID=A0A2M7CHT4_9BACT|nr:MAG: hypothetical protein COV39_02645 [Candidatus Berkelbacteria bacterium CG11_big_fil_rev_8_21_14_0_20_40_23]PIV25187.1 MAG: hypothetical protein COS38_02990 [Candidatus Berkelbacteria bacterium CG03_land_8_20_14_0_80_40_36]PIX30755.1 MAG: hypothetical protein COZ62_00930 [Candidatus Berkelbacteria bacterium CG_4_8_14_3_um_filter_39_27]